MSQPVVIRSLLHSNRGDMDTHRIRIRMPAIQTRDRKAVVR